jgi:hypothetical protein
MMASDGGSPSEIRPGCSKRAFRLVGTFFFYFWHRLRHWKVFWRIFHQAAGHRGDQRARPVDTSAWCAAKGSDVLRATAFSSTLL